MLKAKSHNKSRKTRVAPVVDAGEVEQLPAQRAFWSGTLSFGLVSIPVELYPATQQTGVSLRMLAPDGTPLVRRYYCPEDDQPVQDEELARGYEQEPGHYVVITDDGFAALDPEKSRDIDLQRFVPATAIAPQYFARAYFLAPGGESTKAYHLLADVMEAHGVAGIATFVMHDRQHVVAIFSERSVLRAQTLRFADELRSVSDLQLPALDTADAEVTHKYASLIAKHTARAFEPDQLTDDSAAKVRELAEHKYKQGLDVIAHEPETEAVGSEGTEMIDLLRVLKKSLAERAERREPKTKPKKTAVSHRAHRG